MHDLKRSAIITFIVGLLFIFSGFAALVRAGSGQVVSAVRLQASSVSPDELPNIISGTVVNERGPVAGAIVQVQATPNQTTTTEDGTFELSGVDFASPVVVTAWAAGHFIGFQTLDPTTPDWAGASDITISLTPLVINDNNEYEWYSLDGVEGSAACGLCHREYTEWKEDQHSRSAINHRFLNVYMGTNVDGEVGQPVEYGLDGIPLPPDPEQPYHGPGFRLDNPSRAGNCASCHTPLASSVENTQNCTWSGCHTGITVERSNGLLQYAPIPSPNLKGDAAEGISCEFCHKTVNVILDPETGMPLPDMPGIMSIELARPHDESQQVFFGTLVDVSRQDSYLPLLSKSEYCASCHFGVFGGVVGMGEVKDGTIIYNSYGEWLNSPYSDPETGKTCQDCHMPVSEDNWFVLAEQGGLTRDYTELHNHTMRGASDETLLQNTVTMVTDAERGDGTVQVQVSITNDQAGHDVPTDVPIRSVILVVEAVDAAGNTLTLTDGSTNPDFSGDYGGIPGKTFAKVLKDNWTGETPTAAFWRPVTIVEDNRISPFETDTSNYTFAMPTSDAVTIHVRLIYRRAFYDLMQQKGWNDADIIMEEATIELPAQ
ncbi:MAG: carboxypeptidase-like regulatory domain-containing protein [Chloroflexi bacterium]|nr:carboxypeptidase-like regulatory domain-containing protein [Chloroflexota bacterium]